MTNSSTKITIKPWALILGFVQLVGGVASAGWAWRLWDRAEVEVPASFWGALALALFCVGLAQINLVGPFRSPARLAPPIALPHRLEADGAALTGWVLFSIAFAFGAPALPMGMFALKVEGKLAELDVIWLGLTLIGVLIGGVTLWLGIRKLFEQVNGSQTVVESSAETVKPGETFSMLVQYTPGKLRADGVEVRLICQQVDVQSKKSGKVAETKVLFERELQPLLPVDSVWQKTWQLTLPEDAPLSTDPATSRIITWAIQVTTQIPNAPDLSALFIFTVDDPDLRARWEAEWAAEGAANV